jgi:CheY-like chemotaxis protein
MAKILIVDDDPDFVLVCRTILEQEGYEVAEAANGSIALRLIRQEPPDLVLLDVMMSSTLEGVDVSKEMESDPELSEIPIVMVSSIATTEYAMDFPDDEPIPIEAWISKPVQATVLLRTVKRFVD